MEKKAKTKQTQKCKTWYTLCEHDFSNHNTIQTELSQLLPNQLGLQAYYLDLLNLDCFTQNSDSQSCFSFFIFSSQY